MSEPFPTERCRGGWARLSSVLVFPCGCGGGYIRENATRQDRSFDEDGGMAAFGHDVGSYVHSNVYGTCASRRWRSATSQLDQCFRVVRTRRSRLSTSLSVTLAEPGETRRESVVREGRACPHVALRAALIVRRRPRGESKPVAPRKVRHRWIRKGSSGVTRCTEAYKGARGP